MGAIDVNELKAKHADYIANHPQLLNVGDSAYYLSKCEDGMLRIVEFTISGMIDDEITIWYKGSRIYRKEEWSHKYNRSFDYGWFRESLIGVWYYVTKEQAIEAWRNSPLPKTEFPEFVIRKRG